jgi:hypothetical protein
MRISPYSPLAKWLHWLFEASLLLKGTFAAAETLFGLWGSWSRHTGWCWPSGPLPPTTT